MIDKEKLQKIRWNNFLEEPIVKAFTEGHPNTDLFSSNLVSFVNGDKRFRKKTGINSLDENEALQLANLIKNLIDRGRLNSFVEEISKSQIGRRGFLKWLGFGAMTSATAMAKPLKEMQGENKIDYKKMTGQELYDALSQHPDLYFKPTRSVISNNPKAPVIIILEDVHGSPTIELGKLTLLERFFGFNFVGLEGWAGHEIDKKRGYRLLNAEVKLIEFLINHKDYIVVGLEDENLQIYTLALIRRLVEDFFVNFKYRQALRNLFLNAKIPVNDINGFFDCTYSLFENGGYESLKDLGENLIKCMSQFIDITKLNESITEEADNLLKNYITSLNNICYKMKRLYGLEKFNKNLILSTESSYINKFKNIFTMCPINNYKIDEWCMLQAKLKLDISHNSFVLFARNEYAVKKMLYYMKKSNQRIGIVVFGKGHIDPTEPASDVTIKDNLVQEFLKQGGNLNIIVYDEE